MDWKKKLRRFIYKHFGLIELRYELMSFRTMLKYPPPLTNFKVVFLCNNVLAFGGLCDRLQGMVSIYKVCKEEHLEYRIGHFYPFNLSDYFKPNKVDWTIAEDDVDLSTHNAMIIKSTMPSVKKTGMPWREGAQIHESYLKYKLHHVGKRKRQVHMYTNARLTTKEEFSDLFHELFSPSEELQRLVEWNEEQIGSPYISITTRFQNLLGDFYEGEQYGTLEKEEEKRNYIVKCLSKIEEIHLKHPDKKVLVTSDSSTFLKEAKNLPYVHVNPGKLAHIQYTNGDDDVYLKSFVDLLTIANAEKVYLLITGRMYRSGFAETASFINKADYEDVYF